jgi:hypothetical protein
VTAPRAGGLRGHGARAMASAAAGLSAMALAAGCSTPNAAGASGSTTDGTTPAATNVTQARTRIAPGQTGLEVITWQVTDDGPRFADALRAHAAPAVASADELALRRNGFILWSVPEAGLDALRASLGGSALDMRTWLGTATTWRELVSVPAGDSLIEVDGVAHERPGARARIMARSWPVPMEDGTRIAVEVVPQLVQGEAQASLVRNANRLSGDVVTSCATGIELQRGTAWLLTCDPGGYVETDADAAARARDAAVREGPPAPEPAGGSGKIGARIVTLGAATLLAAPERAGAPSRRTVILLVPHLGGSAFPDDPPPEPMSPSHR